MSVCASTRDRQWREHCLQRGCPQNLVCQAEILVRAVAAQNGSWGLKENLDVQPNGPRLRVAQVQANHVVKAGAAPPADLPQPGDAWLDFQNTAAVPNVVNLKLVRQRRARAHKR